ncbi:hypothetical protein [Mucilaginibacter rubeus]|uniref:hypothetical protein n=1 Tax=Mucilaginibacter rubeus TaxID=2027860 RepID=UPI00166C595D|nr:hypothetical protein [Mucilaginibacter rubeus]GGB22807.1 hypothetical protein GCM10011500_43710 [Mucilaginibacter rubeus]
MYTDRFAAYKKEVVDAFHQRQLLADEDWLIRPTRGRIRQRLLKLMEDGIGRRDVPMLVRYLEMNAGDNDYLAAIKDTDADDFRGFEKFLLNTSISTAEKNVELLAWLIDFPARPFQEYIKSGGVDPDVIEENVSSSPIEEVLDNVIDNNDATGSKTEGNETNTEIIGQEEIISQKKSVSKDWRLYIGIAMVILLVGLIWMLAPGNKECMYWNDDHYVATSCNIPKPDTSFILLDEARLKSFRRIKRVDTLTAYAVGRFWYVRVADSIEVFSAGGIHPLYPDKKLKKVTDYVVNVCRSHHH